MMTLSNDQAEDYLAIIQAAYDEEDASPNRILEAIAKRFKSRGCVFWQASDGADFAAVPPTGRLMTLDSWFEKSRFAMHDLPLHDSATGRQLCQGQPEKFSALSKTDGAKPDHLCMRINDIERMMVVPVEYRGSGNLRGALNVYRNRHDPDFTKEELDRLIALQRIAPFMHRGARDRNGLFLLGELEDIFHEPQLKSSTKTPPSKEDEHVILTQLCQTIAKRLHCFEVSILLPKRDDSGRFEVTVSNEPNVPHSLYHVDEADGLTGYVLFHRRVVRIPDLAAFKSDTELEILQKAYPRIKWKNSAELPQLILEKLNLKDDKELPPLSFMAAPLVMGDELLGVIRCSAPTEGPYYFADREGEVLQIVADLVGRTLHFWNDRRRAAAETEAWRSFIENVSELNKSVHNALDSSSFAIDQLFKKTFEVVRQAVPQADLVCIRIPNEKRTHLITKQCWHTAKRTTAFELMGHLFPLKDSAQRSYGAEVFQTLQPIRVDDLSKDGSAESGWCRAAQRALFMPITIGPQALGVLDILITSGKSFPGHAATAARLISQQLGLYLTLHGTFSSLRTSMDEQQDILTKNREFLEDLAHQLKGPIRSAFERASWQLHLKPEDVDFERNQRAIRGLCRKSLRVSLSMRVLADLENGKPVNLQSERLYSDWLIPTLIENAEDTQLMVDPDREIRFSVNRETFEGVSAAGVMADLDLLQQCIGNLIDNAAKYSYSHTVVKIHGGSTGTGRFHITVENQGIKLLSHELKSAKERGWRSGDAKLVTGEGSGIGLWIVDQIMQAHQGELILEPTNKDGWTVAKLVFPVTPRKK